MSNFQKGKIVSESTKLKMSLAKKGKKLSDEHKLKIKKIKYKVLNTKTNEIFNSVKQVSILYNIPLHRLYSYLCGHRTNKTNFKYIKNE